MTSKKDNFIDKTFTILADIILKILPLSLNEKKSFAYYRNGMSAQADGEYAEALENYYQALKIEEDPECRSYILYNIGLIYGSTGNIIQAIEFYNLALTLNPNLSQAWNNLAVIYHALGSRAVEEKDVEVAQFFFKKASFCWKRATKLAPTAYPQAKNWLQINGKWNY